MRRSCNRAAGKTDCIEVRGARQNNLRGLSVSLPRESLIVFTGVSGSGKSTLAFGTIYAEAKRRYFESVAPYARRLIAQLPTPHVEEIGGLPPAVALEQKRAEPGSRSSVGTLTTLSNILRMLFSRAGSYPDAGSKRLDSDAFSPNTAEGACPDCHGVGVLHDVTEESLVPDPSLSIREKAVAAWPGAWQGKNYRDILATLGYNVDIPFKDLPEKDRHWILFTEEQPVVTVHAEREAHRIQRPYKGTYMSAAVYVKKTFATTLSATLRKRVLQFMNTTDCSSCKGKRLKPESLAVRFGGHDIAELQEMPVSRLLEIIKGAPELATNEAAPVMVEEIIERIELLSQLGLDYLSLDRPAPTLSAGELQRLRLTTLFHSGLFGVVYVLDEPSAGLHPLDAEPLASMLFRLKEEGNTLILVEHELDLVRQADWIVDIGPGGGDRGGRLIYSGPVADLDGSPESVTAGFLNGKRKMRSRPRLEPGEFFTLKGASRHNLRDLEARFPLGLLTTVTGVSGAGKSTLVSRVLAQTVREWLGSPDEDPGQDTEDAEDDDELLDEKPDRGKATISGAERIKRLVCVDQKPIGRTPRSNLATYTGLFDHIRKLFAATDEARKRGYGAGRFSFNVAEGRCPVCEGEGFVSVELLFLPSVYAPCASCKGRRYKESTLEIEYKGVDIASVLDMTVDAACQFFEDSKQVARPLNILRQVGLGYLKLGQPATELSGGEAQRIKLASELKREQKGKTLYLLDEPTTGLHPDDIEKLLILLYGLVEAGNTVIVVEHDMNVVARSDWVIEMGPGAADLGGLIVAEGTPEQVAGSKGKSAPYLKLALEELV